MCNETVHYSYTQTSYYIFGTCSPNVELLYYSHENETITGTTETNMKGKVDSSIATVRKDIIELKELHFQQLFSVHRAACAHGIYMVCITKNQLLWGSSHSLDDLAMLNHIA